MRDTRAELVKQIAGMESQLQFLRDTLASLDAAMDAALKAQARSAEARAKSAAALAEFMAAQSRMMAAAPPLVARAPVAAVSVAADPVPAVEEKPESPPEKAADPLREKRQEPVASLSFAPLPPRPNAAGRYANMKVWKAVQMLLSEKVEQMSLEEIARDLKVGGLVLGDSPVRTVATAVGYMNDKIFHVSKSGGKTLVGLLSVRE